MMETEDQYYMNRAIELADRGLGRVNPNPLVGAVIVKEGRVIAEGWHEYYGGWHAERNAFLHCSEDSRGATLYVTLEPCCHYGKTPPCTEAIIQHGIARVVVGMIDPNPLVAGQGTEQLRQAGIEVVTGVEEAQVREQNCIFLKYITSRLPWVVMKSAMTLDGKIATYTGDSQWVTGEEARSRVQEMRCRYSSILVGSGTARADDPLLNCRLEGCVRQPIRIIVDSKAALDLNSRLVKTAGVYRTIVAHTGQATPERLELLTRQGVETLLCEERKERVSLRDLMIRLGEKGIDSILLEGGGELNEAFFREQLVDEVYTFVAPKIIGGKEAKTPVEGKGRAWMREAVRLWDIKVEQVGEDVLIRGKVNREEKE